MFIWQSDKTNEPTFLFTKKQMMDSVKAELDTLDEDIINTDEDMRNNAY